MARKKTKADLTRLLQRLHERNPKADPEDVIAAANEFLVKDEAAMDVIIRDITAKLIPIVNKQVAGEQLTPAERAFQKAVNGVKVTGREARLASEYYDSFEE
jgi:hypothetical protein